MPIKHPLYSIPSELVLGTRLKCRVPPVDERRQRMEAEEILARLRNQPGVILADEVGMGKTFVALAVAYCVANRKPRRPVVVMVPPHLIDKWEQDLKTFCGLYLEGRDPVNRHGATHNDLIAPGSVRYGTARHSVELMRLLDDPPRESCHLILLAQGAMSRNQTDKWVRLALISEALRRHGRGRAKRLIQVKQRIHLFLAELIWAIGEERAHDWGADLWKSLLKAKTTEWRRIYNELVRDASKRLDDDPVPEAVARALAKMDLSQLAKALKEMPLRARGGSARVTQRINSVRAALRTEEHELWKDLLSQARWRSSLLVMDEAHHLKNPRTSLAKTLQLPDSEGQFKTGDGAMAGAFDRMLFLTATPFQLGHRELVRVLERFADVRWDRAQLGDRKETLAQLQILGSRLDETQRAAVSLKAAWNRLRTEDCEEDMEGWWTRLRHSPRAELTHQQRAVVEKFEDTRRCRDLAEAVLRPWIIRHNKGKHWAETKVERRRRLVGSQIIGGPGSTGLKVPGDQLLPFFLAARSAANPGNDLLGEALCSSYEAFRHTRNVGAAGRDGHDDEVEDSDMTHSAWYRRQFDASIAGCTGKVHPKIDATVRQVTDLWEAGEKVLVFAFYRQTCAALRRHISEEITKRTALLASRRLGTAERKFRASGIRPTLKRIQDRYFDDRSAPGRRALDGALRAIVDRRRDDLLAKGASERDVKRTIRVMRRFLRVPTTLVRCFPLGEYLSLAPDIAVERMLDSNDASSLSWREKFEKFVDFLTYQCTPEERAAYLDAAATARTGEILVAAESATEHVKGQRKTVRTLPHVQVATGTTKRETRLRLMRAFNTPFFPDVFVCSQVMGEGVDLQRHCCHVVHHDLAWNPSSIEQRTGRVDRLGSKAQGREPIKVYLPYLAGTADERQYRVMTEREQWFRIVMGQDEVARLIATDSSPVARIPRSIADELSFSLSLDARPARR